MPPVDPLAALDAIPAQHIPAAIARLSARLMVRPAPTDDELLTVNEAARLLKTDHRWIYRHAEELGATRLSRRKLRLSKKRIHRYLERMTR